MRFSRILPAALVAMGALFVGTAAQAQDWDRYRNRDLRHDYAHANRLRDDMARDQYRYNEAVRCGRYGEANRIARDMRHDREQLRRQEHDIRHDQRYGY
ncbi:MAG TPA: hypothetical protein VKU01_22805 [Bryobacteraceae bacterium]|nr:hypothetical protein [Bryobacteraceae bacterium]